MEWLYQTELLIFISYLGFVGLPHHARFIKHQVESPGFVCAR